MRTLIGSAAVLVLLVTAGCGGDSDSSAEASDPTTASSPRSEAPADTGGATGLTVTDGTTPEDLLACLTGAGLDAAISDSVPFGVEVPVVEVEVTGMTDYEGDPDQGAELDVFADPASAQDNASVLTLGGSDDTTNNRFGVHGNVVRVMSMILAPDPHTDDEAALLGCLPA